MFFIKKNKTYSLISPELNLIPGICYKCNGFHITLHLKMLL